LKEKEFDTITLDRHHVEMDELDAIRKERDDQLAKLTADLAETNTKLDAKVEYQKAKHDGEDLKVNIEESHVDLEMALLEVKELEEVTLMLNQKRDILQEERKEADLRNEELKKDLEAKEQLDNKKLEARLNRDKHADVKERIAKQEQSAADIEEFTAKVEEEKRKFDELKKDRLDLEEKLKLTTSSLEEHKLMIEDQDKMLEELRAQIDTKKASVDTLNNQISTDAKINEKEEKDNRKLDKDSVALKAKLKFIQEKYDFNSNVRNLKPDEFTELENTNTEVSLRV